MLDHAEVSSACSITRELQPEVASLVMAEATSRCIASPIRLSERSERASRDEQRPRRRAYDHRLRNSIVAGRTLDDSVKVPASTLRPWVRRGRLEVVSAEHDAGRETAPALEDACREARARRLEANRRTTCGVCDEPPCERVDP